MAKIKPLRLIRINSVPRTITSKFRWRGPDPFQRSQLSVCFPLNGFIYNSASAASVENSIEYYDNSTNKDEIGTNAVGAVLVFVGGIAAGYIIDGVLIRYTGHSGGEWVAKALSYHKKNPGCKNIGVTKAGHTY